MRASGFVLPSLWLISKYNNCRIEVLTIETRSEEALPVFSFEEEVNTFLRLEVPSGGGWRARETTRGELISMLYGLCSGVRRVLLDPLPPRVGGEMMLHLVSLGREEFVQGFLIGERTLERSLSEQTPEEMTGELAIPDYIMWDFTETSTREAR